VTSNITLNCQSHKIAPKLNQVTGRRPEVAIVLNGAQNVKIKNCIIENFDFGIFAINSKRDPDSNVPPIQIFNNDIKANFVGISFMSVDSSEIRGNRLKSDTRGGRAIYVGRDSDRNRILNNEITLRIPIGNPLAGFRVPGSRFTSTLPSNPQVTTDGSAVLITQTEGNEPSLLNAIIVDTSQVLCGVQNCLFQLTVIDSTTANGLFTDGNVVDGNVITFGAGTQPVDGIALAIPQRTIVSNNTVIRAKNSIRVGAQTGPPLMGSSKQFPGTCTAKPSRFCLANNDCNIPGFESNTNDTCGGVTTRGVFWLSHDTIIQDNIVTGPFDVGIVTIGLNTIIAGNVITGNGGNSVGIRLVAKSGLETTTVTRNSVQGAVVALSLVQIFQVAPQNFKAKISLNDFIIGGNGLAVRLSRTQTLSDPINGPFYDLVSEGLLFSELSVDFKGNNWGRRCSEGGFNPSLVRDSDPSPSRVSPLAKDSHPFQNRVSNTSELTPCL
jgi:hypothetical protein